MANDKTVEYAVTADPTGFKAGMEAAASAARDAAASMAAQFKNLENTVKSSTGAMDAQMKNLSAGFSAVTKSFAAITAVIAGGTAFKAAIGESAAWAGEAKKLSMALGLSTERASVMMVAMRHLGIDSEIVTTASAKMSKQIFTNGQAFEKLGVQTKDASGQYRPVTTIMSEVNAKLKEIQNPIAQNIAGMQVYGKSWQEIRSIMKLTPEELQKAEQKTKDLNLVVGDEGVAAAKKYKESMNDMGLVATSLEVQLGNAVMPAFVKLGSWMSGVAPVVGKLFGDVLESVGNILSTLGQTVKALWEVVSDAFSAIGSVISAVFGSEAPGAMEIFANVLKIVEMAFVGFKTVVIEVIEGVKLYLALLTAGVMRFGHTAERALHLDFAGAKAAWKQGTEEMVAIQREGAAQMIDIARKAADELDAIAMRSAKKKPDIKDKNISGGATPDFEKDGKDKSRMNRWEEKLAIDKDGFERQQQIAGTGQEFGKAKERDFWKNILETVSLSSEEKSQVNRKFLALEHELLKESFDSQIAGEKAKLENFRHNHNERIVILTQVFAKMKGYYGDDSKEAKAAMGEIAKEQRKLAEQTMAVDKVVSTAKTNAAEAQITFAEKDAQTQLALGQITVAKLLELEQGFEAKRYQIKMQGLQAEEELLAKSPDHDPVAKAALDEKMEALEMQHQLKLKEIRAKAAVEQNKSAKGFYSSMQSGMQSVIQNAMHGTLTLKGIFKGLFDTLINSLTEMLAKMASEWLMSLLETQVTSKTSAVGEITANAGVAGAAATASAAAIPMVGWMLAPEAGLAASAAAMGYLSMATASGGYDVPSGLNPITQLHQEEMVLPAKHADVIRGMADDNHGSSPIHLHGSPDDSVKLRDVKKLMKTMNRNAEFVKK